GRLGAECILYTSRDLISTSTHPGDGFPAKLGTFLLRATVGGKDTRIHQMPADASKKWDPHRDLLYQWYCVDGRHMDDIRTMLQERFNLKAKYGQMSLKVISDN